MLANAKVAENVRAPVVTVNMPIGANFRTADQGGHRGRLIGLIRAKSLPADQGGRASLLAGFSVQAAEQIGEEVQFGPYRPTMGRPAAVSTASALPGRGARPQHG
jgi:hypothetical protein